MSDIETGQTITIADTTWRVLTVEDGAALLLRDQIVESSPFHAGRGPATWMKSNIRARLNDEGRNPSSQLPRALIRSFTRVDTKHEFTHPRRSLFDHGDSAVFLLSVEEVRTYLPDEKDRIASNQGGTHAGLQDWWWLRSPGVHGRNTIANVGPFGGINLDARADDLGGVRPALWVDLDLLKKSFDIGGIVAQ